MKNTIHGFNQKELVEYGLDNDDALILRWFVDFKDTGRMATRIIENEKYYWVKYEGIIEDLPILKLKTKDALYRRFKKMDKAGVIKHITYKENGTFSFYTLGEKYITLITRNNYEEPIGNKSEPIGNKSVGGTEINPEQIISLLNNKESKKEEKPKRETYNDIISSYTENTDLKDALIEFIKMRKNIKSPMTNKALKLLLNKLDKLAKDDDTKINILDNSILNNWKSVYELKENTSPNNQSKKDNRPKYDENGFEIEY